MAMDLEYPDARPNDRLRFGLAERWIIAGAFTLLMVLAGWIGRSFSKSLESLNKGQAINNTQLAVANSQLTALRAQQSDIRDLAQHQAELKVQVQRNTQDIKELRSVRGLK